MDRAYRCIGSGMTDRKTNSREKKTAHPAFPNSHFLLMMFQSIKAGRAFKGTFPKIISPENTWAKKRETLLRITMASVYEFIDKLCALFICGNLVALFICGNMQTTALGFLKKLDHIT